MDPWDSSHANADAIAVDNNDGNTTAPTTDWDSGDSEGVDYVYKARRRSFEKGSAKAIKSSPPGRQRSSRDRAKVPAKGIAIRCTCGAAEAAAAAAAAAARRAAGHGGGYHSNNESTAFEEDDTDVEENHTEYACHGAAAADAAKQGYGRRLSAHHRGGRRGSTEAEREDTGEDGTGKDRGVGNGGRGDGGGGGKKMTSPSGKKLPSKNRKRTPYIEEYPGEPRRPVILLREHKLPRRFSTSDAKHMRDLEDRPASVSGGSRGRSPPSFAGKRLPPAWVASPSPTHKSPKHQILVNAAKHRSDLDDNSQSESEREPTTPRHRHRQHQHHPGHVDGGAGHTSTATGTAIPVPASTVARSSAWTSHYSREQQEPQYSSSWPMQSGAHYPQNTSRKRRSRHCDQGGDDVVGGGGYESEDESDDQLSARRRDRNHGTHHPHHQHHYDNPDEEDRGTFASTTGVAENARQSRQRPHASPPPPPIHVKAPHRRPRQHSPLRPVTVASRRSFATGARGRSPTGTEFCEIWRGRPEDWESPYNSDLDVGGDDDDDDDPGLLLLDETPRHQPALLPPPAPSTRRSASRTTLGRGGAKSLLSTRRSFSRSRSRSRSLAPARSRGRSSRRRVVATPAPAVAAEYVDASGMELGPFLLLDGPPCASPSPLHETRSRSVLSRGWGLEQDPDLDSEWERQRRLVRQEPSRGSTRHRESAPPPLAAWELEILPPRRRREDVRPSRRWTIDSHYPGAGSYYNVANLDFTNNNSYDGGYNHHNTLNNINNNHPHHRDQYNDTPFKFSNSNALTPMFAKPEVIIAAPAPAPPPPPPPPPAAAPPQLNLRGGGGGGGGHDKSEHSSSAWRRGVSRGPVFFAARRTREFLCPQPKRTAPSARFNFDAWATTRSSLALPLLSTVGGSGSGGGGRSGVGRQRGGLAAASRSALSLAASAAFL